MTTGHFSISTLSVLPYEIYFKLKIALSISMSTTGGMYVPLTWLQLICLSLVMPLQWHPPKLPSASTFYPLVSEVAFLIILCCLYTHQYTCERYFLVDADPMYFTLSRFVTKQLGWMEAWVDGVTTEIAKRNLTTNVDSCEAVINYLMSLGISLHGVENMVSLCKPILGRSVDELATVVSWLERKGVSDRKLLVRFLMANPVVLIYNPSSSDDVLEKGKSRISLALGERGGVTSVGIILYREDAAFGTAPVSPVKP